MSTRNRRIQFSACAALAFLSSANAADRYWTGGGGGTWNTATYWCDHQVPTAPDHAIFNVTGTSYPIFLTSDVEVSALSVDRNAVFFTNGSGTLRHLTAGSVSVGAHGYVVTVNVGFGVRLDGSTALTIGGNGGVGHLQIANGGQVATESYLVDAINGSSIDFRTSGLLELQGTYHSPVLDQLRADIAIGYHGSDWQGAGITSTQAQTNRRLRVGYAPRLPVGTDLIDVKLTLGGDANLDGATNFDDLLTLAHSYDSPSGKHWNDGDFDYDGDIDFNDLLALAQQYGRTLLSTGETSVDHEMASSFDADWARAESIAPEPVAIIVLLPLALAARRTRSRGSAPA